MYSSDVCTLVVIASCGYSMAICFLDIFAWVGHLGRGGAFMLIGHYIFGNDESKEDGMWHLMHQQ